MIDWNNDGRVDPAEVIITEIILGENDDLEAVVDNSGGTDCGNKESWTGSIFHRRKGGHE